MFLKKLDNLSPEITLYYNGEESHGSIFSGIFTIFYYLILILSTIYFSLDLIQKKAPQTFYINSFKEDVGSYTINDTSLFHFISMEEKGRQSKDLGFDFTKFRVIGFQTYIERYLITKNASHFDHYLYGSCNNSNYTQNAKTLSNYEFFGISACITKYFNSKTKKYYDIKDPGFKWPIIAHGSYNQNNTGYSVMIERCKKDTLDLVLGEVCSNNDTEFEDFVKSTAGTMKIYFKDNYIDVSNYKNPYTSFINKIDTSFNLETYSLHSLQFTPTIVGTNDGFLFDNNKQNISYFLDSNDEIVRDKGGFNIYIAYYFSLHNMNFVYERTYEKIQDIISEIGGVNDILSIVFFYINIFINKYITLSDTKKLLDSSISSENIQSKNSNIINSSYRDIFIPKENKRFRMNSETLNPKKISFIMNNENINKIEEKNIIENMNKNKDKNNNKITKNDNDISINFCYYIINKITCGKKKKFFDLYENFREKIISEEHLVKNYLNTYSLKKIIEDKSSSSSNNSETNDQLKDLTNLK